MGTHYLNILAEGVMQLFQYLTEYQDVHIDIMPPRHVR